MNAVTFNVWRSDKRCMKRRLAMPEAVNPDA